MMHLKNFKYFFNNIHLLDVLLLQKTSWLNWKKENLILKLVSSKRVGVQRVYDIEVNKTHNFVANGIVVHNCTSTGAQNFFRRAKPRSIVDIAALTSIYRPGPLAAKVDELWTKHEHEPYDWGHPLVNETLKETRGLLVFQKGVMALANKVAGYPLEKCDEVRRAIMKRSISGGEAAKKKVQELEDSFIEGCMKNGLTYDQAKKTYETICFMSGYGFNMSHAVAYAFNSYVCAYLHTYFEEEWLCSYLKASSSNPKKKANAISDLNRLGYTIENIDVNYAGFDWVIMPGKKMMASLVSCNDIGTVAAAELIQNRPYSDIISMFYTEDGTWRFSKFNKTALAALIKIKAFASLQPVGEGCIFKTWKQMYHVLIENIDQIKKQTKKEPTKGVMNLLRLAEETSHIEEWTPKEFAQFQIDAFGVADVGSLIPVDLFNALEERSIKSIENLEKGERDICWFVLYSYELKKTKTGKDYIQATVKGLDGVDKKLYMWGYKEDKDSFEPLDVLVAEIEYGDFGMTTTCYKVKKLLPYCIPG